MQIFRSIQNYPSNDKGTVVTIGNFDGVHLGHQSIIRHARNLADRHQLELVVLTFDPTPAQILRPDKSPKMLSTVALKQLWFGDLQVDSMIVQEPDASFLTLEPEAFIAEILAGKLKCRHIVEGQTFNFGRRGMGTFVTLKEHQSRYGYEAHLAPSVLQTVDADNQAAINSTLIRHLIVENQFKLAGLCLGRSYMLPGQITGGRGDGNRIGFPTVNIKPGHKELLIPPDGVFGGWIRWGKTLEQAYKCDRPGLAAISIGPCPTFTAGNWQIEAHILDFQSERAALLDCFVLLGFVQKIRDQARYQNMTELQNAIKKDCVEVRTIMDANNF